MTADALAYECVICTRNRVESLRLSLPRVLRQTRTPRRVIVVDSSDDHGSIVSTVEELAVGAPCDVSVVQGPRGLTVQRNLGLEMVTAPVVIFPDDDAICDDDYAERLLRVYECDTAGLVGCVVGTPRFRHPEADAEARGAARMHWSDRIRTLTAQRRVRLERKLITDPFITLQWEIQAGWSAPDWLADADAIFNCFVRGFRMSFRTQALRDAGGFNERLRRYAAFEDIDAGLSVAQAGYLVLQAMPAMIFHNQAPGGRGSPRERGAMNIANRLYVVVRHTQPGSRHRRQAVKYACYRCLLYGLGSLWAAGHRSSFVGAIQTLVRARPLLRCDPSTAGAVYADLLSAVGVSDTSPQAR